MMTEAEEYILQANKNVLGRLLNAVIKKMKTPANGIYYNVPIEVLVTTLMKRKMKDAFNAGRKHQNVDGIVDHNYKHFEEYFKEQYLEPTKNKRKPNSK